MDSPDCERKLALMRYYERIVGVDGSRKARKNSHSKRRPIQCGLTVHPGNDCAYSCIYCYIPDMGFKFRKPIPCELSPEELALSLLYNPSFAPGKSGTYIALGSIVEPFQPELKTLAIGYIRELAKLGNPIQFSSKSILTRSDAETLSSDCNWVSPLITILTLDNSKAKILEPLAPTPAERLGAIRNLSDSGLKPFLFLRPILPGIITTEEYLSLIDEAIGRGARGVVLGNFRVTSRIFELMKKKGLDLTEIARRAKIIDDRQRGIRVSDIQSEIEKRFTKQAVLYERSCCASTYCYGLKQCTHEASHRYHRCA